MAKASKRVTRQVKEVEGLGQLDLRAKCFDAFRTWVDHGQLSAEDAAAALGVTIVRMKSLLDGSDRSSLEKLIALSSRVMVVSLTFHQRRTEIGASRPPETVIGLLRRHVDEIYLTYPPEPVAGSNSTRINPPRPTLRSVLFYFSHHQPGTFIGQDDDLELSRKAVLMMHGSTVIRRVTLRELSSRWGDVCTEFERRSV